MGNIGREGIDAYRFLDWFAGFVDGEGCFTLVEHERTRRLYAHLVIKLRDDDLNILLDIQERLQCGTIYFGKATSTTYHRAAVWAAQNQSACDKLVSIFDAHPLRAKKARDYAVWRLAVIENRKPPKLRAFAKLRYLRDKLLLVRAYEPQEEPTYEPDAIQLAFPEEEED